MSPEAAGPAELDRRGVALALTSAFLWSLTGVTLRFIEGASTWQIIGLRSAVMLAALAAYLAWRYRGGVGRAVWAIGRHGLIGGAALGFGMMFYISAIQTTTIANVAMLTSPLPLLAALLARLVLGEAVAARTVAFAAIAAAGAALMVVDGIVFGGWAGNLLALGAVLCMAMYTVAIRQGRNVDMLPAVAVGALVSCVLALALAGSVAVTATDFGLIAVVGLVSTLAGNAVFILAARRLDAAPLALLSMAEIVMSPLWVAVLVGELPTPWALIGGMVIVGAVLAQVIRGARTAPASP